MRTLVSRSHSLIARPDDLAGEREPAAAPEPVRERPAATKSGMAWIWVRLIGVAFVFKVLETAYELVLQLGLISNVSFLATAIGATVPGQQTSRLWIGVVLLIAQLAAFAMAAWYFLRKGKALHNLLMFERDGKPGTAH